MSGPQAYGDFIIHGQETESRPEIVHEPHEPVEVATSRDQAERLRAAYIAETSRLVAQLREEHGPNHMAADFGEHYDLAA